MPSTSLAGTSPLSPNPNIGNIPLSSDKELSSFTGDPISFKPNAARAMPSESLHRNNSSQILRRAPLSRQPRTAPCEMGHVLQQRTPPSSRARMDQINQQSQASLPRRHYAMTMPSPVISTANNLDFSYSYSDDSIDAPSGGIGGPLSDARSTIYSCATSAHMSRSKYSNGSRDDDKENSDILHSPMLASLKSKLAQNRLRRSSKSDSLRSILGSSRDEDSDCNVDNHLMTVEKARAAINRARKLAKKPCKVDLFPKIAASPDAEQLLKEANRATSSITMTAASSTIVKESTVKAATTPLRQKRTKKCLRSALEVMQSKSYDSTKSNSGSSSSSASLDDPFFDRLNAKLDSFKTRRRVAAGKQSTVASSQSGSSTGSRSTVISAASSAAGRWLSDRIKTQSEMSSSTFSVSPVAITKDPREPDSMGSYIGSIYLEGTQNNEPSSSGSSMQQESMPDTDIQLLNAWRSKRAITKKKESANPSIIKQSRSFPPQSINDKLCIEQVSSAMTPDNNRKSKLSNEYTSSPSPQIQTHLDNTASPIIPCGHSPAPSIAFSNAAQSNAPSYATSYATSTATDATSEAPNMFDMLRNNFNHGSKENSSDEDSSSGEHTDKLATPPQQPPLTPMPRPPLSPMPSRTYCMKYHHGKGAVAHGPRTRRKAKPLGTTSKMSPMVVRGTPCKSLCSSTGGSIFDSSVDISPSIVDESPGQELECQQLNYSFLAHALVATNILATPENKPNKKLPDKKSNMSTDNQQRSIVADEGSPNVNATASRKGVIGTSAVNKRSHRELGYASLGATNPAFGSQTPTPRRVDPMALALEAETTTPEKRSMHTNNNEGCDLVPRKRQRMPSPNKEQDGQGTSVVNPSKEVEDCGAVGTNKDRTSAVSVHDILSIASALDDASSLGSRGSRSSVSQEEELAKLVDRVEMLESKIPSGSALDAYLDGSTTSSARNRGFGDYADIESTKNTIAEEITAQDQKETVKLRERIKWLEKILGFGRGASQALEDEIKDLKENLVILERRLEEEMVLKEEASQKAVALTTDIEATRDVHKNVEACLREKVQCLESELKSEKVEQDGKLKQGDRLMQDRQSEMEESLRQHIQCLDSQLEAEKKKGADSEEVIKGLKRTNEELVQDQHKLKNELVAFAKDNDCLRGRLLSLAGEVAAKEQTMATALSQLSRLSEDYYRVSQSLEYEQNKGQDEVTSLQWSLDDMSCQMLKLSKKLNQLQAENDGLRDQMKRQRLEKQRSTLFRRSSRGL